MEFLFDPDIPILYRLAYLALPQEFKTEALKAASEDRYKGLY